MASTARCASLTILVTPLLGLPTKVGNTPAGYALSERNGFVMEQADAHFSGATKDVLKTLPDSGSIGAGHCQKKK